MTNRRVLVLGAGTAGCIVAARLSEDAKNSVVLLEAGPDYPDVQATPADLRSAFVIGPTSHDWGTQSEPIQAGASPTSGGQQSGVIPVLRGKVVGGSSAVNATIIRRPFATDFDAWVAAGNDAWSWEAVLPALRLLEDDPAPGAWHGQSGPLPVYRFPPAGMLPLHRAFLAACAQRGYPLIADHNAPGAMGAGPLPLNQADGIRHSAAVTHLLAARHRSNLQIRPGVVIDRIEIVAGSPRAVILADGERLEADLVVLTAGVYGSPAILMRSGLGPAAELSALGIEPVADLPALGSNLRDHPMVVMQFEGNHTALGALDPAMQTILTLASDGSADPSRSDLDVALRTIGPLPDVPGAPPATVLALVALTKPRSVGRLSLASTDPQAAPRIWLNFFDEPSDLDRMLTGIDAVRDLVAVPALQAFAGKEMSPGADLRGEALAAHVRTTTPSYAHGTGTCRMGPDPATSVVDQTGRVHGFDNLWVIDASIMPAIPSVPTNFTTMMLAERCVSWLRAD